ncbi:MAG: ethanolamine utilization protein EutJ [Oscillospiraceae bacterium]|nr:ethanolamine utilization protein EutJ [Oscillospiraceae bacterium]
METVSNKDNRETVSNRDNRKAAGVDDNRQTVGVKGNPKTAVVEDKRQKEIHRMDLAFANELSTRVNAVIGRPTRSASQRLKCGVDLGTAYIVLMVLDENDEPIACEMQFASVIKDGLVVDYFKTLDIVKRLKGEIEEGVGQELLNAAIAMPPGMEHNTMTHRYIVESAGFEVRNVLDEPSAANAALRISNGVVVDVGGGTTGFAVFRDGKVVKVGDEPTGGVHLSLVIAGGRGISLEQAEEFKQEEKNHAKLLPVVRPVLEKMATIVSRGISGYDADMIYLCGGTCRFEGVSDVFEEICGIPALVPENPMLITPLGIAMCCPV